jgi:hypothetical protein
MHSATGGVRIFRFPQILSHADALGRRKELAPGFERSRPGVFRFHPVIRVFPYFFVFRRPQMAAIFVFAGLQNPHGVFTRRPQVKLVRTDTSPSRGLFSFAIAQDWRTPAQRHLTSSILLSKRSNERISDRFRSRPAGSPQPVFAFLPNKSWGFAIPGASPVPQPTTGLAFPRSNRRNATYFREDCRRRRPQNRGRDDDLSG